MKEKQQIAPNRHRCRKEECMSQKEVSRWLKGITIAIGLMGVLFFFVVMPYMAQDMADTYPEVSYLMWPGMIYGWGIGVICYAILYQFWKVCVEIGRDNSFSAENARAFVMISRLSIVAALVWFVGIVVLALVGCLGAAFGFLMILIAFIFIVVAILAAALSHLIYKSYELKQEQDLTI